MSSRDSSSQDPSFYRRNSTQQPSSPASDSRLGFLSPFVKSEQAPDYQSDAAIPPSTWPYSSSVPTLPSDFQSAHTFQNPPHERNSTTSLSPNISFHTPYLDSAAPRSRHSAQSSYDSAEREEQSPVGQAHGLGISSYMSVASDTYFAPSTMHPNSQNYGWPNPDRPFQPVQSPSGNMNQPYPSSQPYSSSGYHFGDAGQPGGQTQTYSQNSPTSSYLPGPAASAGQNQSSSPSLARPFPPPPRAAPTSDIHDQSLMPPPAQYMMSPTGYYLPDAPPLSSHTPSMSSDSSSMVAERVFSPTESVPSSDTDHSRVPDPRSRPKCWDHGCNGREFSTFSNLLRHQREKSGVVAKAECPVCGAVFTRTTARNIHVAQGKCKGPARESSAE